MATARAYRRKEIIGYENALENRLNCKPGERQLHGAAASVECEVEGQIDHQRSGGDERCRAKGIEVSLPHGNSAACGQERREEEQRVA